MKIENLVLASSSPRRAELLRAAGIEFEVCAADIDETPAPGESPEAYVRRMAEEKALHVAATCPGRVVLGADTAVIADGDILGKPADADDARRMLQRLAGRSHVVMTGVALARRPPDEVGARLLVPSRAARTTVEFAPLSAAEIEWYVASGEPMGKAGAYAIQGLGSRFVASIEGSYSNVVGLPVALVWRMCMDAGILVS